MNAIAALKLLCAIAMSISVVTQHGRTRVDTLRVEEFRALEKHGLLSRTFGQRAQNSRREAASAVAFAYQSLEAARRRQEANIQRLRGATTREVLQRSAGSVVGGVKEYRSFAPDMVILLRLTDVFAGELRQIGRDPRKMRAHLAAEAKFAFDDSRFETDVLHERKATRPQEDNPHLYSGPLDASWKLEKGDLVVTVVIHNRLGVAVRVPPLSLVDLEVKGSDDDVALIRGPVVYRKGLEVSDFIYLDPGSFLGTEIRVPGYRFVAGPTRIRAVVHASTAGAELELVSRWMDVPPRR